MLRHGEDARVSRPRKAILADLDALESSWQASGPFRRGSTVYMARTQPSKFGLPDLNEGWGFWRFGIDADAGDPGAALAFYERHSDADAFALSLVRQGVRVRQVQANPGAVETGFTRRLRWQPIYMACGHWEERLTRDRGEDADPARATASCDRCEPRYSGFGDDRRRIPQAVFEMFEDAKASCDQRNREDKR